MKKLLLFLAGFFLTGLLSAAPPPPDPRLEKIKARLALADLFGLQAPTGITQASLIDFAGVGAGLSGCPPPGKARAFYDLGTGTFRVINSSCVDIIGGGGGGGSTKWNTLIDPDGDASPNFGGTTFTFSAGTWNWGSMRMQVPQGTSPTPTLTGQIVYDSSAVDNLYFFGTANSIIGRFDIGTALTDGDPVGISFSGSGSVKLVDLPTNTDTGTSLLQVTNFNTKIGDVPCVVDLGPPIEWDNCTVGVPPIVSSATTYTFDGTERGEILFFTAVAAKALSLPQASDATDFDANWFTFVKNDGAGDITITATTSTFFSTGSNTLTITQGIGCSIFSDPTAPGVYYDRCSPVPFTASTNISLTPAAYAIAIAAAGGGGGTITGAGTSNTVTKWTGAATIGDSCMLDDGTHAVRCDAGFDVNAAGRYLWWATNNTITGTTASKMACDDGANKAIICPFASSTTNDPLGVAIAANGATPGTSGSTGICVIGFCPVVFDNGATAGHYAQSSSTVDGDLSDVGATKPTNGQDYWYIYTGNSGAGTAGVIRNLTPAELNASSISGGNGRGLQLLVNGTPITKPKSDLVNGTGITFVTSNSGNTTTITPTVSVNTPTGGIAGTWQNVPGSSYTIVDGDNQIRLRFTGTSVAVTLGTPNTVVTNAFVSQRVQSNCQGVNTCTSGSFTPAASNQLAVMIQENDSKDVTGVTLSTGETCTRESSTIATNASFIYYCTALLNTAKTLTVTFSGVTAGATLVSAVEVTGTTFGNASTSAAAGFTTQSLTNAINFPDAVSMAATQNGTIGAPPWIETDTLSNNNIGSAYYRLMSNSSSVTLSATGAHTLAQMILSASSHPSFTAGWYFLAENASSTWDTITPTASTINGQTTLVLPPNSAYAIMSNGANWDAIALSSPNLTNNGVAGQATIVYGRDAASQTSAIADFTMTTAPADMPFRFSGSVSCHTSVATATATLNLKWTDVSNTAQTLSTTATCTTLGVASVGDLVRAIRAKSGTTITFGVAIANSPNFDVSVRLEQF